MVLGHAVAPGLGGVLVGGVSGFVTGELAKERKTRVFVSFDFHNDRSLKHFIIGQSKNRGSGFKVVDRSLIEAAPEHLWEKKAAKAIKSSDLVLVLIGEKTHEAQGVLKEVEMARQANVRVVQVQGYKGKSHTRVPNAGRVYRWNSANLQNLLSN